MKNSKHLPTTIPKTDPFFELKSTEGTLTKQNYEGRFECQIPNLRIQANIAKYLAFLNGGMDATLDPSTKNLHKMHAYCKFTLTEYPDWFKDSDFGYDLYDTNILEAIYNQILAKEEAWLEKIWGKVETEAEVTNG